MIEQKPDDYNFAASVVRYFTDLAYLHNYYPVTVDHSGRDMSRTKDPGHGRFDAAVRKWVGMVSDLIMSRFYRFGKISDPDSVEALASDVANLKRSLQDHELEVDLIRENCIVSSDQRDCAHCAYAASCIGMFAQKQSVYEYFVKTFDFKKVYLNSIFIARNSCLLEEVPYSQIEFTYK